MNMIQKTLSLTILLQLMFYVIAVHQTHNLASDHNRNGICLFDSSQTNCEFQNNIPPSSSSLYEQISRGGSELVAPENNSFFSTSSDSDDRYDDFQIIDGQMNDLDEEEEEEIDYERIAFALRLNCEVNRQLYQGSNGRICPGGHTETLESFSPSQLSIKNNIDSTSDMDNNSRNEYSEPLTIFHAKEPRPRVVSKKKKKTLTSPKMGTDRWGPNLSLYLQRLHEALECPPITFALALIYLDRVCSAATVRDEYKNTSPQFLQPCPHLTPRTVHRLVLTAIVVASKAVKNDVRNNAYYASKLEMFGMTEQSLSSMETWFVSALGEEGTFVSMERIVSFSEAWEQAFPPDSSESITGNDDFGNLKRKKFKGIGTLTQLENMNSHNSNTQLNNHGYDYPYSYHQSSPDERHQHQQQWEDNTNIGNGQNYYNEQRSIEVEHGDNNVHSRWQDQQFGSDSFGANIAYPNNAGSGSESQFSLKA